VISVLGTSSFSFSFSFFDGRRRDTGKGNLAGKAPSQNE
jgi:hypothetical protein